MAEIGVTHSTRSAMKNDPNTGYPDIVPCLVVPFEMPCWEGTVLYPALVFARRGPVILFAAEYARRFGVATWDGQGEVEGASQFPTLDTAARAFLSHERAEA
jgi:hypothetical protein